jgi:hypothetical protein
MKSPGQRRGGRGAGASIPRWRERGHSRICHPSIGDQVDGLPSRVICPHGNVWTRAREADPRWLHLNCWPSGTSSGRKLVERSPQDVPTQQQEALEIGTTPAVFLLVGCNPGLTDHLSEPLLIIRKLLAKFCRRAVFEVLSRIGYALL